MTDSEIRQARIGKLLDLIRDMDYCLSNSMSCDQCEIRPCRLGERGRSR